MRQNVQWRGTVGLRVNHSVNLPITTLDLTPHRP